MHTLFDLSFLLVAPFWAAMILLPGSRLTALLVRTPVGPALPALAYLVLLLPRLPEALPVLLRPQLDTVAALLATPGGVTLAWLHFLAFDLFLGRWAHLDARARGLPGLLMAPVLLLTLLFGPVGFLVYLAVRALVRRPVAATAGVVP